MVELAVERRAHAITRGLLANVTAQLAEASLRADGILTTTPPAGGEPGAQEG